MKKQIYVISGIVVTLIIAIFVLLNMEKVTISFGFAEIQVPLILIILSCLLLGALLLFLFSSTSTFKQNKEIKTYKKEVDSLNDKIKDIKKNQPKKVVTEKPKTNPENKLKA
ncbi:lipopolysaccharide assembly protein LapA domain-containing protein [Fructilactobacillus vespulae]|uniref:lipopolysaccharide assembly protein LapA domain-containing protein n=1 Tax=Fructilactobacillus vespulae TaxID=1249630 RepID=UPI0039B5F2D9